MATAIAGVCETEFPVLTGWFNITTGFGASDQITVTVQQLSNGGANNFGYQSGGHSQINVNFLPAGYTAAQANAIAPMMFVNELVEVFMSFNNQHGPATWNPGHSDGEGLSQFCGILRFPVGHYLAYGSWANAWLKTAARADYITSNENTDGNAISFGCVLLFLFYLNTQLGFTPAQIIQQGGTTPAATYSNLTGDSSNPFGFFLQLVGTAFPGTSTISGVTGQKLDDPFPIFTLQFWDNKNTFGLSEVTDSVSHSRPFTDALLLVLEGFSPRQWQALGSTPPAAPSGAAAAFPGISFTRTQVEFENSAVPLAPQRIHFHYDIGFAQNSSGGFTTAPQTKELDSSITISGQKVGAITDLYFFGAYDPYFSSINPVADNVPWLSQDLRVFATVAGGTPVPGAPAFSNDSMTGARTYLKNLLGYLSQQYGDPSSTDPFDPASGVVPYQTGALTGDSSVIPNLSFLGQNVNVYNFAVARVRLLGAIGASSKPVKVFFRLWQSQTPDTDYQPTTTYDSQPDALSLPDWPLPDPDSSTFPFFATSNNPVFTDANNPELGVGGVNNKAITIANAEGQWSYFGCLLNVYDQTYLVNGTPVPQLLAGTHHCLVAQIAYDDAPIIVPSGQTVGPGNTDKLAQRNLQITAGSNPGTPPTNRVPQTFDVRPTSPGTGRLAGFDELMIDWGETPVGSVASIYWPAVSAQQVLALADAHYAYHGLTASDPSTIQCDVVNGLTYVPIPPKAGPNFAGLLTVELPPSVVKGQRFTVIVHRVTTFTEAPPPQLQSPPIAAAGSGSPDVTGPEPVGEPRPTPEVSRSWRYITGAFQVDIPVQADEDIRPVDENILAIFKWRLEVMPSTDRWQPVLQRYVSYLSDRIDGLGGNAAGIAPSPTGLPFTPPEPVKPHPIAHSGKIVEVVYDCFGDFDGFVLGSCEEERFFASRERGIEHVVLWALKRRATVKVISAENSHRIEKIVLVR